MTAKWSDLLNGATVFRNHGQFAARSGVKTMLPCQQLGADLRDFQTNVGLLDSQRAINQDLDTSWNMVKMEFVAVQHQLSTPPPCQCPSK